MLFINGRIATEDGSPIPHDTVVERVCNSRVRQQVYASTNGDFSMQLGAMTDALLDASADGGGRDRPSRLQASRLPGGGISRTELASCDIRANLPGFRSTIISLVAITPDSGSLNVGNIIVHRAVKPKGMTLSATPYQAPKDARKAFEKGMEAAKDGNYGNARKFFETAVQIHPKYIDAWFQLGSMLENLKEREAARAAYEKATSIDSKFLPPYLSLAGMEFETQNWNNVIDLTNHVIDLDPMKSASIKGYILDLDTFDFAEAYFYNSVANYRLSRFDAAEKSGLRTERLDVRSRFPQVHLLLASLFAKKGDYANAISQANLYLGLLPRANDAEQVRQWVAKLEQARSTAAAPPAEQPVPN